MFTNRSTYGNLHEKTVTKQKHILTKDMEYVLAKKKVTLQICHKVLCAHPGGEGEHSDYENTSDIIFCSRDE